MIREVEVDGRIYEIDTTPDDSLYATLYAVSLREASGVLANALGELTGDPMLARTLTYISDAEAEGVILALGWKYSRSRAYKRLYDLYAGRRVRRRRGQTRITQGGGATRAMTGERVAQLA